MRFSTKNMNKMNFEYFRTKKFFFEMIKILEEKIKFWKKHRFSNNQIFDGENFEINVNFRKKTKVLKKHHFEINEIFIKIFSLKILKKKRRKKILVKIEVKNLREIFFFVCKLIVISH